MWDIRDSRLWTTEVMRPDMHSRFKPDSELGAPTCGTDWTLLRSLIPREERILRMRSGIGMNTDHSLEEVGQPFSVMEAHSPGTSCNALHLQGRWC